LTGTLKELGETEPGKNLRDVWLTIATIIMATSGVGSSNYHMAFFIAVFQFSYWGPAIVGTALSEFAFSFLPIKSRTLAYPLFCLSCLAVLIQTVGLRYKPGTENFSLLVYPAAAVCVLYMARSFARQHA
jgi:hypothetical protein